MVKFAERLKELRLERNVSRRSLAEKLSVSVRLVSYWESGDRECDFQTLIEIANFFEVSVDYLLGNNDY